ncbi:MAG: hypothetical protein JWR38_2405 [Mucilaginibacter sp.]|nr:hypothetical protein [Mucilaginibacter sp.]
MITFKAVYTVKQEFAKQNQENINAFMQDFQKINNADFRYNVYLGTDGQTFTHVSHYKNAAIQQALLAVPSFKYFQEQRDNSGLEDQPQLEEIVLIDSSSSIFN